MKCDQKVACISVLHKKVDETGCSINRSLLGHAKLVTAWCEASRLCNRILTHIITDIANPPYWTLAITQKGCRCSLLRCPSFWNRHFRLRTDGRAPYW